MANFSFNKVILGGRICADPELKMTVSGISVCKFNVAVNRREKPQEGQPSAADFFTVIAWKAQAEFVAKYFRKGSSICITGILQNSSWVTQSGEKRYKTEVIAQEIAFVDSKSEPQDQSVRQNPYEQQDQDVQPPLAPQFSELGDDEELPF